LLAFLKQTITFNLSIDMQHTEFTWTTPDGVSIFAQTWSPDTPPRAVVALAHGLGEHAGRYAHVARFFADNGIATVAYDRRGHGKSGGKRGHTPDYAFYLDEVETLVAKAKTQFPNLPAFLYGHSMGGNIILNYALRRNISGIAGVISSAAVIKLAFRPNPIVLALGKLTKIIYPTFTQKNQLDVAALSRDQTVVDAYVADPLVHDSLTSVAGLGILEYADYLCNNATKFPVPLYITHGSDDRLTSSPGSEWFAKNYTGDIKLKIWNGLYHEIHNEPEQADVLGEMVAWMNGLI
jgi:alpha-beta hydrolase superfamily lysophospholipase